MNQDIINDFADYFSLKWPLTEVVSMQSCICNYNCIHTCDHFPTITLAFFQDCLLSEPIVKSASPISTSNSLYEST